MPRPFPEFADSPDVRVAYLIRERLRGDGWGLGDFFVGGIDTYESEVYFQEQIAVPACAIVPETVEETLVGTSHAADYASGILISLITEFVERGGDDDYLLRSRVIDQIRRALWHDQGCFLVDQAVAARLQRFERLAAPVRLANRTYLSTQIRVRYATDINIVTRETR